MSTRGLIDPKAVAAAAIASGLLIPAPPSKASVSTTMRHKTRERAAAKKERLSGDEAVHHWQQIHALKAAGYSAIAIADRLKVSVGNVNYYLHDPRCKANAL